MRTAGCFQGWSRSGEPRRSERIAALALALGATGAALLAGLLLWPERTRWILGAAGLSMAGAGKLVVLGGCVPGAPLGPWELALLVIWMDLATGLLWVYNLGLLARIPWMGPRLRRLRIAARKRLRARPWLGRQALLGIVLFVLFPLAGTGAIGASITGDLLGMRRSITVAAILCGALLGAGGLALLGETAGEVRARELVAGEGLGWIMGGVLAAALALLAWRLMRPAGRSVSLCRGQ